MKELFGWIMLNIELILIGLIFLMLIVIYAELNRKIYEVEKLINITCKLIEYFRIEGAEIVKLLKKEKKE